MMKWLERLRIYRILKKHSLPDHLWHKTTKKLVLLNLLDAHQMAKLRTLSTLFIYRKNFIGAHNLVITQEMKIIIASHACLAILELGIDAFEGWADIIIYPSAFKVERETQDSNGLVSIESSILSGEAWGQGPVILSWEEVERDSFALRKGHHVVIHEFAHKLDMLNGRANGMPPLHPHMEISQWTESLSHAYAHLIKRLEHHHGEVNAYASTNPAEFFAVMSEYYFTAPNILIQYYPKVYHELKAYYLIEMTPSPHPSHLELH